MLRETLLFVCKETCISVFIAKLFVIAKKLETAYNPTDWINTLWFGHIIESYTTDKMNHLELHVSKGINFKTIMLSETKKGYAE